MSSYSEARMALKAMFDISTILSKLNIKLQRNSTSELIMTLGRFASTPITDLESLWSPDSDANMVVEGEGLAEVALMQFALEPYAWYLKLNPKSLYDRQNMDLLFQSMPRRATCPTVTQLHNITSLFSVLNFSKEFIYVMQQTDNLHFMHSDVLSLLAPQLVKFSPKTMCWKNMFLGKCQEGCNSSTCVALQRLHFWLSDIARSNKLTFPQSKQGGGSGGSGGKKGYIIEASSINITVNPVAYADTHINPQLVFAGSQKDPVPFSQASTSILEAVSQGSMIIKWGTPRSLVGSYGVQDVSGNISLFSASGSEEKFAELSGLLTPDVSMGEVPSVLESTEIVSTRQSQQTVSYQTTFIDQVEELMGMFNCFDIKHLNDFIKLKGFAEPSKYLVHVVRFFVDVDKYKDQFERLYFKHIAVRCILYTIYTLHLCEALTPMDIFFDLMKGASQAASLLLPGVMCRRIRFSEIYFCHDVAHSYQTSKGCELNVKKEQSFDGSFLDDITNYKAVIIALTDLPHDANSLNVPSVFLGMKCYCRVCMESILCSLAHYPKGLIDKVANHMTFMHLLVISLKENPDNSMYCAQFTTNI